MRRKEVFTYTERFHLTQGLQGQAPAQGATLTEGLQHSIKGQQVWLHALLSHVLQQALVKGGGGKRQGQQASQLTRHNKDVRVSPHKWTSYAPKREVCSIWDLNIYPDERHQDVPLQPRLYNQIYLFKKPKVSVQVQILSVCSSPKFLATGPKFQPLTFMATNN